MLALIADVRSVLTTQMVTFGTLDNAASAGPKGPVPAQSPLPPNQPDPADEVQRLRAEIDRLVRLARDQELLLTMTKRMGRIGTWAWSAEDQQLQLSEEARGIFGTEPGYPATSLARFLASVHPDDRAAFSPARAKRVESFSFSCRVLDGANAFRTLRIDGAPQLGPAGCLGGFVGTFQDVTEHHLLLSNAQEANQRLRDRDRSSREYLWELGSDLRFTSISGGNSRTPAKNLNALIGCAMWELPNVRPVSGSWDEHMAMLRAGQTFNELEFRFDSGDEACVLSLTGHPVHDTAGRFLGYRGTALNITKRVTAEALARRSQTLLRRAMRLGRLAAWTLDVSTRAFSWTSELPRIPGSSEANGIDLEHALSFVDPSSRARLRAGVQACVREHKSFQLEVCVRRLGHRPAWLRVHGERLPDEPDGEIRIAGAVQDITEQVSSQAAMERMSMRLTQTVENISEAFIAYDASWRFLYVNQNASGLLGLPREELLGRSLFECFPAMRDSVFHRKFEQALQEYRSVQFEAYSSHSHRWYEVGAYPSVDGLAVCYRDVTDLMQMRLELRSAQERYQKLFETSLEAIFQIAPDGTVTATNPAACTLFGYSEADLQELDGGELVDKTDPRLSTVVAELKRSGRASGQMRMVRSDRTTFEAEISASNYTGADGRVYTSIFVRDVTERIDAQERMLRWNTELANQVHDRTAELEAANEQLRSFAYALAHDLRAPISATSTFSDVLLQSLTGRCTDRERRYLERIQAAGARMDAIVHGILALATVSHGDLQPEEVDLASMARELISELQEREPGRHVNVHIPARAVAVGDRRLLHLALQNLLSNAWKFTARREDAELRFEVTTECGEPTYHVSDNGAGFDMAYAHKLFAPFERLHGQSEFPGTGIGLSTVQRVVLRHGGRVWATSREGEGAKFSFSLGARGATQ